MSTLLFMSAILCVLLFLLLKFFTKQDQLHYYASKIKGPMAFPIIGSSYVFFGGTERILENTLRVVDKYQPVCKLWMGSRLVFFVSIPEDVNKILNNCLERAEGYSYLKPVVGYGLFTQTVKDWKADRKVIVSAFNQHKLETFVKTFNDYSMMLVNKLKERPENDYFDAFLVTSQCTLDIVCSTIMGTRMDAMKDGSRFIPWMTRISELSIVRMFNSYLWPDFIWRLSSLSKESKIVDKRIEDYVETVIERKRLKQSLYKPERKACLEYFLELADDKGVWTEQELTDETRTVIIAASDTTSTILAYCLVLLGMHPEIQDRMFEEVFSVFGNSTRGLTTEDLPQLDYVERFVKETLRLFPSVSSIGRKLTSDLTLSTCTLPKDCSVFIPILYIQRNSLYWPDPLKFDPDRFLPEEVAKRRPGTYMPFSTGPRGCMAPKYATMEMKVIMTNLVRHYKVVDTPFKRISDIKMRMDVSTKSVAGYPVKLQERKLTTKE